MESGKRGPLGPQLRVGTMLAMVGLALGVLAERAGGEEVPEKAALWSEKDTVLITYADSIRTGDEPPLETLRNFLNRHAKAAIRTVHLLPFYPWTSDDGFSVVDYRKVKSEYGSW